MCNMQNITLRKFGHGNPTGEPSSSGFLGFTFPKYELNINLNLNYDKNEKVY